MFTYIIVSPLLCRVFKQALHTGGGQLTVKHVEEVSLAVLFLMEAAKKTDEAFQVKAPSNTHTQRESDNDIIKMVTHLTQNQVHILDTNRKSPVFTDPTETGWKKIGTTTWLKDTLSRSLEVDDDSGDLHLEQELDLDYELADI